jgi:hypothetical protein
MFAQATSSGTITGAVTDPTGAVVPEATITITDPTTKAKRTTVTNKSGQYVIPNVTPGVYDMSASKGGFSMDQIAGLTVSVGSQTTANFKMVIGSENTTVEVTASNADLQTMNASTGSTVDTAMVENLPAISREVSSFLTLQPGVTPGGNVAGTTTDQATFTLDGGSNSSDMDGTNNVYTAAGVAAAGAVSSTTGGALAGAASTVGVMPMPQDSVEEFKVSTTGQTADFNNSSGGQTQVVTKRGRDRITGSVYEYYLDNNFNANSWQNNFTTSYTPKPAFHYSRFGVAAGGPILPFQALGGKTYLFVNYEGFRYPNFATYERVIPSYSFLNTGLTNTFSGGTAYTAAQLTAADPRKLGLDQTLKSFYSTQLPLAPASGAGSTGANGTVYPGSFDSNCAAGASTTYCDGVNTIGYKGNVSLPETSNFLAARLDHDFGAKWHLMVGYRYYHLKRATTNQVGVCGTIAGGSTTPCNGQFTVATNRPQVPWYGVVGLTTNISSSLTNDFHYSYLRNLWQYAGPGDPAQVAGAGAAIEPFGDQSNNVMSPYNVDSQDTRTRTWDGKDNFFSDNVTKLKGDHLIQVGGQYQHNFNYHLRTDNGATINYQPLYLIGDSNGAGNIGFTQGLQNVGGGSNSNYNRDLAAYYGLVTDTQLLNTYQNVAGVLSLQKASTPYAANTTIPYYNIYATDTWHMKPSITLNYGLSYAVEMPPTERYGYQAMLTDASGNAIYADQYLAARKAAALTGAVYEPQLGFANVNNVTGGRKYAYNPFYGGVSPRISAAWNPKFKNKELASIFGDGATVIRGGYGRLFGRLNGDVQVLNPLLSPPIIIATQCQYLQTAAAAGTASASCLNNGAFNDNTVARFGTDGTTFATASAPLPTSVGNVYRPGLDGPGIATASPDDPGLRPNDVDTINFSIQRQIGRRSLLEVGYIGRLIHHEYQYLNPNTVPYMMTLGGQSFESAYVAIETAMGCTTSTALCATRTAQAAAGTLPAIADQPFFAAALGGSTSAYCAGYANCTAAVVKKQASNLGTQKVFSLWKALDNSTNGTSTPGFVFGRSLSGTPINSTSTNALYGTTGQIVSGATMATGDGYGNYHGGYVSFKTSGLHGFTFQENLTWSKALGLSSVTQSSSSGAAQDSFNLSQQYGRQAFDQKIIFNTFIVYNTPWFKQQHGIVGRAFGGWTVSPVVVAGTGQPQICTTNNGSQSFGGDDGSSISDTESCIFTQPFNANQRTHRGVFGGLNSTGTAVGTSVHAGGPLAAVNIFKNPAAVYDSTRPAILGYDPKDAAAGTFQGLPYLNVDFSVKKNVVIYEKYTLELSGIITNALNHMEFANASLAINTPAAFGVTKTQGNNPRQIQAGARINF